MEPQERDLITTLLTRLQSAAGQPKDAEADTMIRQAMTQMPDAPYYLVQTVLIQDLSLHNAQNRIAELEKQVASLPAPQQQPTSFLGGLFGRSQSPAPAGAPPSGQPAGGPWTRVQQSAPPPPPQYAQPGYAQPGYAQPQTAGGMFGGGAGGGGNSFLRSAATTAAGVAGGALLFEGISSLFGHGFAGGLGGMGMGGMGMGGMPGGLGETVINNYNGDNQGAPGDYGGGGDYSGGGDYGGGGDNSGGGDYGGGGDFSGGGDSGDYGGGGDSGGGSDSSSC
jgi:hypothetical protein